MSKIILEDFNEGDGYYKINLAYLNKEQIKEVEALVSKWNPVEESEDERIKNEVIKLVHFYYGSSLICKHTVSEDEMITWLKKQGEQTISENYKQAEKEKRDVVGRGFMLCNGDILDFKEGESYWLEYIGDDKYNVRSDNLLGKTYHLTPMQFYLCFRPLTWLEKQGEQNLANSAKTCKNEQKSDEWHREDEQNLNACLDYILDEFLRRWLKDSIYVKYLENKMQSTIIWHSVREIPDETRELLCEWKSEDATWHDAAFYHTYTNDFWNGSTKIEGVTKWIYIDELLEKKGKAKEI